MHKMVTGIALDFVNITAGELEDRINRALADIGRFSEADRVYIFSYDFEKRTLSNTYEWCATGIHPEIETLQNIPFELAAGVVDQHEKGETVLIPRVANLTEGSALKILLSRQGIRSMIGIPMMHHAECLGFVGLDSVRKERNWAENEITILRLFAELLANIEIRARNEQRIRKSENRHKALLQALPDLMFRLTAKGTVLELYCSDTDDILIEPDQCTGRAIAEILPDYVAELCIDHLNRVCQSGQGSRFEYHFSYGDQVRHYEARVVKSDRNEVIFVVRNITEKVQSDTRLRHITSNIPGAIYTFTMSPAGRFNLPYISESILELAGVPASGIQSDIKTVFKRINDECKPSLLKSIRKSASELTPWRSEFRILNSHDKWIWVQAESTPHAEPDGSITWYGHVRDINAQREAEEQLAHERDLMSTLMETIPDQIYFKDLESRFIRSNKATAKRLGFSMPAQLTGKSDYDFFTAEHAGKAYHDEQQIITSGKPLIGIEEREVWPDGRITWASTTKMPLYDRERKIIGTYGISRDITERKESEQVFLQRKAFLTAVIENQIGFIWLKDLNGRFILVNQKFAKACNYDVTEDLIGKTEFDINPLRRAKKYHRQDENVIQTGKTLVAQEKISTDSGDRWFETFKSPVFDQNGAIIGTTGFTIEITERKRKVEQVRRLNRKLNDMNIQKDKLFSILAHDLRNPFTGSIGMFEMILSESGNLSKAEIRDYIELLHENTLSTYALVENLLEWSRTQRNRMSHSPEFINLRHLVDQTLEVVSNSAINKQIQLKNLIDNAATVYADRDMLHTILRNLITNGIKFTRNGGSIRVEGRKNGRMFEIDVTDSGVGIRKEELQKLFRIDYVPSSKGTNGEKGSGLGLQICKEFAEKHGGCLSVESKPGIGSTFRVKLPHKTQRTKAVLHPAKANRERKTG